MLFRSPNLDPGRLHPARHPWLDDAVAGFDAFVARDPTLDVGYWNADEPDRPVADGGIVPAPFRACEAPTVAVIRDSTSPTDRVAPRLGLALREEFRRIRRPPYSVIWCIVINFVLVTTCWFLPVPVIKDFLFTLHKTFWFPLVMASWLIADVPATNELAPDRWRVLAALDDEAAIERLLRAKHIVLWMITTPMTVIAALIVGIVTGDWITMEIGRAHV